MPYAEAWSRVVVVLQEAQFGISIIDDQAGYIETDWKTTKQCEVHGEPATCERARVVVRVVQRSPFRIKLKTDRVKPDIFSYDPDYTDRWGHYKDWRPWGNDRELEKELIRAINKELSSLSGGIKKARSKDKRPSPGVDRVKALQGSIGA